MDGHVWRVPTLFGVMASSALLLFAAAVIASVSIRRRSSTICKLGAGAALALLATLAAVAVRATATLIARSLDISVAYVDPGPLGYVAPAAFAAFAFAVGRRMLKEAWIGRRAVLFYAWLLGFTAANVINWCAPGWCVTVGFPLPWHAWSDEIVTFGDGRLANFMHAIGTVIGAAVNLLTFVGVARVLVRARNPG